VPPLYADRVLQPDIENARAFVIANAGRWSDRVRRLVPQVEDLA
jgi:hypothetical protein